MPAPFPHHHRNHSLLSSAPRATRGEEHTMATATTTAQVCRNFINGRWVESRSGRTVERRNPANLDEIIGLAPLSTREETREAIAAARNGFAAMASRVSSREIGRAHV